MRIDASAIPGRVFGLGLFSSLAIILLAPGFAGAQPVPLPDGPEGPAERAVLDPERLDRLGERLGLKPAKLKVLKDRLYDAQQERIRLMAALELARLRLRRLLEEDAPAEEAVMAAVEQLGQLRTSMHKQRLKLLLGIRAELSVEQRRMLKGQLGDLEGRRRRHRVRKVRRQR